MNKFSISRKIDEGGIVTFNVASVEIKDHFRADVLLHSDGIPAGLMVGSVPLRSYPSKCVITDNAEFDVNKQRVKAFIEESIHHLASAKTVIKRDGYCMIAKSVYFKSEILYTISAHTAFLFGFPNYSIGDESVPDSFLIDRWTKILRTLADKF